MFKKVVAAAVIIGSAFLLTGCSEHREPNPTPVETVSTEQLVKNTVIDFAAAQTYFRDKNGRYAGSIVEITSDASFSVVIPTGIQVATTASADGNHYIVAAKYGDGGVVYAKSSESPSLKRFNSIEEYELFQPEQDILLPTLESKMR